MDKKPLWPHSSSKRVMFSENTVLSCFDVQVIRKFVVIFSSIEANCIRFSCVSVRLSLFNISSRLGNSRSVRIEFIFR